MKEPKEKIMSDAIRSCIELNKEVIILKRAFIVALIIIAILGTALIKVAAYG